MSAEYNSGRSSFIGWGLPTKVPISLDPRKHEGATVYGEDGILYYSDGVAWTAPINSPIRKPYALEPVNSAQQSQLRLSTFLSGTGFNYTQMGIIFEVYADEGMSQVVPGFPLAFGLPALELTEPDPDLTAVIDGTLTHLRNSYQLPIDIFQPETVFYWRAKYLANDGQESIFSDLFEQKFPAIIDKPFSLRKDGVRTDKIEVSKFVSAFSKSYYETTWEFYDTAPIGQTPVGIPIRTIITDPTAKPYEIAVLTLNTAGVRYYWRARHQDNEGNFSAWSSFANYIQPEQDLIVVFDTRIGTGSSVVLRMSGSNIRVNWGDGSPLTTAAPYEHTYDITEPGEYRVTITNCTSFAFEDDGSSVDSFVPQEVRDKLVRIDSLGNLTYLRVSKAKNLVYVSEFLPPSYNSLYYTFSDCSKFNQDLDLWNTANVGDMRGTFANASIFNGDVSKWNTSKVGFNGTSGQSFASMFSGAVSFSQDINYVLLEDGTEYWNTRYSQSMAAMFRNARAFNGNIRDWDLSDCTSTASMFEGATSFNNDLSNWNFSFVQDVSRMFYGAVEFNRSVGLADFGAVKNFAYMFANATNFNRDISHWVLNSRSTDDIDMSYMFNGAKSFNRPINSDPVAGTWNTTRVVNMAYMFYDCVKFNQPIDGWNTSNVKNTSGMFYSAKEYNQPIGNWNMAKVENLSFMFYNALVFNKDLNWDLSSATDLSYMFAFAAKYNGATRFILCADPLKTVSLYAMFYYARAFNADINYSAIDGAWNTARVTNLGYLFADARMFNQELSGWDVSKVTSLVCTFYAATSFNKDISAWDVSNVTDMYYTFYYAIRFNQPIGAWNVGKVTRMSGTLFRATDFNQQIDTWDVSKVTSFDSMLRENRFNQPLAAWVTSSGVSFTSMFYGNQVFNQAIGTWDMSKATSISHMFYAAKVFNNGGVSTGAQSLNSWNVANMVDMTRAFGSAEAFNQPLDLWNTAKVYYMHFMFWASYAFNQPLNSWDVANVRYMHYMFGLSPFNRDLASWNTSKVLNMSYMFYGCSTFNGDITTWNTMAVTDMRAMFYVARAFNRPILYNSVTNAWNTANVSNMGYMFYGATAFNQAIGTWLTNKVVYMDNMLASLPSFNQDISNWNVRKVENMRDMLYNTTLSINNYDNLLSRWSLNSVVPGVVFNAGKSKYSSAGSVGRNVLTAIPNLWTIIDGGLA